MVSWRTSRLMVLLCDSTSHQIPGPTHAPVSARPLLIGLAYAGLQPLIRPRPLELAKCLMVGIALLLRGVEQLLPPGSLATVLADVVITLYVVASA